jgi:hypothetical protein
MHFGGVGIGVFGLVAIVSLVLAGATIWLMLTSPVSVATAVTGGDVTPLVRELARALLDALAGLLRYF